MRCKVETVFIARAMEARKEGRYEMLYIVNLVIDDNAQEVEGVSVALMRDLLGKLREHEVPV